MSWQEERPLNTNVEVDDNIELWLSELDQKLNRLYGVEEKPVSPREALSPVFCLHNWVDYLGLNEYYSYCKHCDLKRPAL